MIVLRTILIFICISVLTACQNYSIPKAKGKIDYSKIPNYSCKKLRVNENLFLDSLYIPAAQASLEGVFFLKRDTLCFADQVANSVLFYDLHGKYLKSKLSKGRGPNEILGLDQITDRAINQGYIIMGQQWDIYQLDSTLTPTKTFRILFGTPGKINEPDPNNTGIYEVEYAKNKLQVHGETLFFPIVTEHVHFNAYEGVNANHYYTESFTLAAFSLAHGQIEKKLCNYSPIYQQYKYASNFKYLLFEVTQNDLLFTFEIDSLIYRMNLRDSSISSFGNAGIGMHTDYPTYQTFEDSEANHSICRKNYGYYRDLKWIPETNTLLRTYQRGGTSTNGLQVYRNNCLVADWEIPQNFKLIGYYPPYYYAFGTPDYDNERFIIYKFQIP